VSFWRRVRSAVADWWHWNGFSFCYTCRRPFRTHSFWNPWGPNKGPGLCCSEECCDRARRP